MQILADSRWENVSKKSENVATTTAMRDCWERHGQIGDGLKTDWSCDRGQRQERTE